MAVTDPYKLNTQRLIQVLSDPLLYVQCPVYLFMEEMARACFIEYLSEVSKESSGCNGCDDRSRSAIAPAINTFVRHTRALSRQNPHNLDSLRQFLHGKLGYQPTHFVLYYKERGKPQELRF